MIQFIGLDIIVIRLQIIFGSIFNLKVELNFQIYNLTKKLLMKKIRITLNFVV